MAKVYARSRSGFGCPSPSKKQVCPNSPVKTNK